MKDSKPHSKGIVAGLPCGKKKHSRQEVSGQINATCRSGEKNHFTAMALSVPQDCRTSQQSHPLPVWGPKPPWTHLLSWGRDTGFLATSINWPIKSQYLFHKRELEKVTFLIFPKSLHLGQQWTAQKGQNFVLCLRRRPAGKTISWWMHTVEYRNFPEVIFSAKPAASYICKNAAVCKSMLMALSIPQLGWPLKQGLCQHPLSWEQQTSS